MAPPHDGQAPGSWSETATTGLSPATRPGEGISSGGATAPPAGSRTAEALDTTTADERRAALAAPAGGEELGRVVVSLGSPTEPGFWLRSGVVATPTPGVVRLASGRTAQVDLLPGAAGTAQLSLAAYRALGLGLTDLPEVTVLRR